MTRIAIICVEDDRPVLDALVRDLEPFTSVFRIEATESAEEARGVIRDLLADNWKIGLVLADHILPGENGVDLLIELHRQPGTAGTRKVLVTAQAGHQDTIKAVNSADLDHYIMKPWSIEELHGVVRRQLTDYVLANADDLIPFMRVLDSPRLLEAIRHRGTEHVI
jgi:response regulator RpfG family c-di-GMP phosphodiesterase